MCKERRAEPESQKGNNCSSTIASYYIIDVHDMVDLHNVVDYYRRKKVEIYVVNYVNIFIIKKATTSLTSTTYRWV